MRLHRGWYTTLGGVLLLVMSLLGPSSSEAALACSLWDASSNIRTPCPAGVFPTTCAAGQSLEGFDPADGVKKLCVGGSTGGTFLPVIRMHQAATTCNTTITQALVGEPCVSLDTGDFFTCSDPAAAGDVTVCDTEPEWLASGSGGAVTITDQQAFDNGTGRIGPLAIDKPRVWFGETLEERAYEQGGNWIHKVVNSTTGLEVSQATNILAGLTKEFLGNGVPILALDGTTARSVFQGAVNYCLATGATNTYACSLAPPLTAYVTGACYRFNANAVNTGAATLNLNSLGAKTIKKAVGGVTTDLVANDIRAGQVVDVCYDGTNLQMQSVLGNAAAGGSLTLEETDDSPSVANVVEIRVSPGTLIDDGNGIVRLTTGGGGAGVAHPIRPYSRYPVTAGTTFPNFHDTGAGTGARRTEGLGVAASLVADADWELRFQMPTTLVTGCTYKARLKAQAAAATGNAQVEILWAGVAAEEDPSAITHSSEGVTQVAWGSGDTHQFKVTDVTLDANTANPITGGEEVSMILRFESTNWTLAQISTWNVFIICN